MTRRAFKSLLMAVLSITAWSATQAEDTVFEVFQGDTPASDFTVDYRDLSKILNQTVWETGQSNRAHAGRAAAPPGSRIVRGNRSRTRNEGNRIDFHSFLGDNLGVLVGLRRDLEKVPDNVALERFTSNEQLAYWLNLYNLTVLTQVSGIFPEERLKKHYFGGNNPGLWDQKILTVSGIKLSLNDIHHKILIPKWGNNPLIMYGLFQGMVGGPNIRDEAFTGTRVWQQLEENAEEFVNSVRGTQIKDRIIKTSYFYEVNEALFPDFERDLKHHLYKYANPRLAERLQKASSRISPTQTDWFIADLYGGNRSIGSVSTNPAALLGGIDVDTGDAGYSMETAWFEFAATHNFTNTRFPVHLVISTKQIQLKNQRSREGTVEVEEYSSAPDEQALEGDPEQ